MKYLPTVNLWDESINKAIKTGQMRLQCGQWVKCGQQIGDVLSRFVTIENGVFNVVHGFTIDEVNRKFKQRVENLRISNHRRKQYKGY